MSGSAFHTTRMGARFFEGTMPKIADELGRLNATLTEIAGELRASNARPAPGPRAGLPARPP